MATMVMDAYPGGAILSARRMTQLTRDAPAAAERALSVPGGDWVPALDRRRAAGIERVVILATGARRRAALAARDWFDLAAGTPVEIEAPGDRRRRASPARAGELAVMLTDGVDGDDRDGCLEVFAAVGAATLAIGAAPGRTADAAVTLAGGDFITSFVSLARVALSLARWRDAPVGRTAALAEDLARTPSLLADGVRATEDAAAAAAEWIARASVAYIVAAGALAPAAEEGAAQMAAAAGLATLAATPGDFTEALLGGVGFGAPVIGLAFGGDALGLGREALFQAGRRGGRVLALGDPLRCAGLKSVAGAALATPGAPVLLRPAMAALCLQVLASAVGRARGG